MSDDLFAPEELTLIDRLRNAPQPDLKPQAVDAIRQLILRELDQPPVRRHPVRPARPMLVLIGAAIMGLIAIVVIYALLISRQNRVEVTPGTTSSPTVTTSAPTATTPSQPETNGSILQPTFRPTSTPGATAETVGNDTVMVIEGPIQTIDANIITIFGMTIRIDPGDAVLTQLQVGKMVHVEGHLDRETIVAVKVVIVSVTSPGMPSNCKMSKHGHIKCSKKKK